MRSLLVSHIGQKSHSLSWAEQETVSYSQNKQLLSSTLLLRLHWPGRQSTRYALLRMGLLSISYAEGFPVISCGKSNITNPNPASATVIDILCRDNKAEGL
jgi:hypothetical protein